MAYQHYRAGNASFYGLFSGDGVAATIQLKYALGRLKRRCSRRAYSLPILAILGFTGRFNGIITLAGTNTEAYAGDGGSATSTRPNATRRVAFDPAGNLFIACLDDDRIRKVATNDIIATFAGNGTGSFSGHGNPASKCKSTCPLEWLRTALVISLLQMNRTNRVRR